SGSMDLYSRFLLQFLFALQSAFSRVETFTFSVRLTRVTEYLRARSYREVLRRLTAVKDWSGGTKIGESLAEFNRGWASLVDRRTIVMLLSDGWDTGDPELLAAELLRIKRRAGRVIWLNPLLGNPSYEPLTRGMAAALPLVHRFPAAHNLAALRELAGSRPLCAVDPPQTFTRRCGSSATHCTVCQRRARESLRYCDALCGALLALPITVMRKVIAPVTLLLIAVVHGPTQAQALVSSLFPSVFPLA